MARRPRRNRKRPTGRYRRAAMRSVQPGASKIALPIAVLLLSSCMVGPEYQRPATPEPPQFVRTDTPLSTEARAVSEFWQRFGDPELDRLVDDTLRANYDLRA